MTVWDWLWALESSTAILFHLSASAICVLLVTATIKDWRRR